MRLLSFLFLTILSVCSLFGEENKPRVSIITSVYKGDLFIQGFLEDIVKVSIFDESELIIINANSPGNEEPIIKEYVKKYPNIVYLKLDKDPGLYGVWNLGIKMAKSDLITNANIDDRRNFAGLKEHIKILEQNPGVDLVYSPFYVSHTPNETFEKNNHTLLVFVGEFSPAAFKADLAGPQPTWRKSMHEKAGYFDESFEIAGDYEMWLRAIDKGSFFKRIEEPTGVFYFNPKGLSTDPARANKLAEENERIFKKYKHIWS